VRWRELRAKYLFAEQDERAGDRALPLLSVSAYRGVVPRTDLTADEARADDLSRYKVCAAGDVVINRMSAYQGAAGVAPNAGLASPDYTVLRATQGVSSGFLGHLIRSRWFTGQISARLRGIGGIDQGNVRTPRINTEDLGNIVVRLPPLSEQTRIADFLDAETARIDALIEKKQRLVDVLHQRWRIARRNAVTIGVDANVPKRSTGISWLTEVPAHWRVSKLQHLGAIRSGSTPSTEREDYWDGDVPWVSPKDMKRFEIDSSQECVTARALAEVGLHLTEPGCVLFVVRGMILAHTFPVALNSVPVTINQDMKTLSLTRDDPRFVAHLLAGVSDSVLALLVEESAHGTRVLRMDRWKGFPLFLPPLDEQRKIVRFLDEETGSVNAITRRLDQQIALLREHRQALISAAVTGELDVSKAAA
jgi:type I restriction enzyme S subunit